MVRFFAYDESGAISGDWLTMSAGILVLGIVVIYAVMGNSVGYLIEEFDALNIEYSVEGTKVSSSGQQNQVNR